MSAEKVNQKDRNFLAVIGDEVILKKRRFV